MYQATKNSEHYVNILFGNDDVIYVHIYIQIHRYIHTSKKQTPNILLKCDISFWKICQKLWVQKRKSFFALLNLSQKYGKMFEIWFRFESLKIALHMVQIRLLHFIFKASLLRHTLKTLIKLSIKLNHIYGSYYVQKFFEISFTIYVNAA